MTQEPSQISPWESKIVRAIGKANLWLAAIGFAVLLLNVWGFHQAASFLPSFGGEQGKIIKTAFFSEYIVSGILLLIQAYVGWRLLRHGAGGIASSIWTFCGLILYFLLVCGLGIWGPGAVRTLVLSQPGIVLDWEMVTGYPAAAAVLLFFVRKNGKEAQQNNKHLLTSPSGFQVLGFLGWANIIVASISLCATFWKIWAYHQLQSSLAASSASYAFSEIFKSTFYVFLMAGAVLFVLQAYTGWRLLRQDIRIIKACIVIFAIEILYFASIWGYAMYFRVERILTLIITRHPAVILDLQMVAGYPAAAIALLYCFQKLRRD